MPLLIAPTGHSLDLPARHLTFGESPECDIPLAAGYGLASLHFEIAPATDGGSYLRDASAGVGTLINGLPVAITLLRDGDVIQAGQLTLRFSESPNIVPPMTPAASVPAPAPAAIAPAKVVQLPSTGEIITASEFDDHAEPPPLPAVPHPSPAVMTPRSAARFSMAPSPLLVRVTSGVLLLIAATAFCATDPGQRLIQPWIAKIQHWNTARPPKANPTAPAPGMDGATKASEAITGPAPTLISQTPHQEITRRLLTERTQSLIYADLLQLIPCYNLMASQQNLPSQRELSEFFRKTYGAVITPFEQLSFLQTDAKDEFLFILTAKTALDLEKIIGQPARPGADGRPNSRTYPLTASTRSLSAVLYDPFTLLIGSTRAITRATQPDPGPQLREARCMFPETAHRTPGALIMVKRVNLPPFPSQGAPVTAFETVVSNLFLDAGSASTLTLTRNPEVREQAFVDAAAPALKEQAAALASPLSGSSPPTELPPGEINLTLNEASIAIPGGPALISSALETTARSFTRAVPSMSTILQAQDAVMRFNSARATGAAPALKANSPREAIELLNEGIRGGGQFGGATFQFPSKEEDLENLSSLLALDESVGLVYRPDSGILSGSSLELALKARNYRTAELLINLWQQANLTADEEETAATASSRILTWATTPEGRQQRCILGLPSLTADELAGALAHLSISEGHLIWKPGETNYRGWVRLVHPNPHGDAARLATTFNAATAAGAIPASATRDLKAALSLITRGVAGRGEKAGTTFQLNTLTPAELSAAGALLTLEAGQMKVTATPGTH